jgi:glycerol-3-phosphate O-acyltransferase
MADPTLSQATPQPAPLAPAPPPDPAATPPATAEAQPAQSMPPLAPGPIPVPATANAVAGRLPARYGPFARWLLQTFFGAVPFPTESVESLRQIAERATPVYVLRSSSLQHLLYFNFTFWKLGLPIARAATGLGIRVFGFFARWYMGGKQMAAAGRGDDRATAGVLEAVKAGESALVFLRQPRTLPGVVAGLSDPFPALVELQCEWNKAKAEGKPLPAPRPIVLVPLTFLWRRRPRQLGRNLSDLLFGDPEEPGAIRAFLSFFTHRSTSVVRVGAPVDLAVEVEKRAPLVESLGDPEPDATPRPATAAEVKEGGPSECARIARRVRGFLHQHLARESRVVTGPPLKRPERVKDLALRDLTLRRSLAEIARERGRADGSVEEEARECLEEIAARYSPLAVDLLKRALDVIFNRIYDGVDVDLRGIEHLKETMAKGPLILCPCHKSHIDYLILSYVFDEHGIQPPHVAAGDNLNFFPVGRLLRMGGAFFIRRSFKGDKVYQATLSAYVKQLMGDGFTQEFFPEGGRSRTGKLLPPKFGMLGFEVDAFLTGVKSDAFFCPVSVSYEKLVEGASYQRELLGGEKQKEDAKALLGATKVLRSRYGRITIRFDAPISLKALFEEKKLDPKNHTADERRKLVAALGWRVSAGINRAAPLAPMGLVCAALLSHDRRGMAQEEVFAKAEFLHTAALDLGARVPDWMRQPPDSSLPPTLRSTGLLERALETLRESGDVRAQAAGGETFYSVPDERRFSLDYHKNGIIHFLVAPAILAAALRSFGGQGAPIQELFKRAKDLSRLLKNEFIYEPGRPFEANVDDALARLLQWGLAEKRPREDGEVIAPLSSGLKYLLLLSELLRPFAEGVWIVADTLTELRAGPLEPKEWSRRAMDRGRAAFLAGRLRRSESLSKALLDNALAMYRDRGVVAQGEGKAGKLSLGSGLAEEDKLHKLTEEIAVFFN